MVRHSRAGGPGFQPWHRIYPGFSVFWGFTESQPGNSAKSSKRLFKQQSGSQKLDSARQRNKL
jgi:hypothetical protein